MRLFLFGRSPWCCLLHSWMTKKTGINKAHLRCLSSCLSGLKKCILGNDAFTLGRCPWCSLQHGLLPNKKSPTQLASQLANQPASQVEQAQINLHGMGYDNRQQCSHPITMALVFNHMDMFFFPWNQPNGSIRNLYTKMFVACVKKKWQKLNAPIKNSHASDRKCNRIDCTP